MRNETNQKSTSIHTVAISNEIMLTEVLSIVASSKLAITAFIVLFTGIFATIAHLKPDIYRAEIKMIPQQKNNSFSHSNSFEGIGSLVGMVGFGANSGDIDLITETLTSKKLIRQFISEQKLKTILFEKDWDKNAKSWTKRNSKQNEPSDWDSYNKFQKLLHLVQKRGSRVLKLQVDWTNPELAAKWANLLVQRLNHELREQAISENEKAIAYLESQVNQTSIAEIRTVLYNVIEDHTKSITLARISEEYAVKVIDPALAPQYKISPNRLLLTILGAILGTLVGIFLSLVTHYSRKTFSKSWLQKIK